jgi:hypothetical protein
MPQKEAGRRRTGAPEVGRLLGSFTQPVVMKACR